MIHNSLADESDVWEMLTRLGGTHRKNSDKTTVEIIIWVKQNIQKKTTHPMFWQLIMS